MVSIARGRQAGNAEPDEERAHGECGRLPGAMPRGRGVVGRLLHPFEMIGMRDVDEHETGNLARVAPGEHHGVSASA
ncbi:MAG: hypothetical protein AVDCRST_MAG89-4517 [uncultured Gemmatimonadetes bacterium]|uniref:Uncharacterized protein n=1 Tax=uncultured Gemmatimonadota bacterium TaxID=203437 RepID=A0A6J4MVK9_9BACT|nr:MAG: hypothetical protein AVDCRST_MAG89-4517 [uncultured Gemmatimonadota bacterium]